MIRQPLNNISHNCLTFGYCMFYISLPFSIRINNLSIVILCIAGIPFLALNRSKFKLSLFTFLNNFYPILIYYLFLIISFIYVYDENPSPQHLETRFGMIGLPFLISFVQDLSRNEFKAVLLSFVGTIFFISIIGIVEYIQYLILYGEVSTWILTNSILIVHRPIWGLFLLSSIIFTYILYFELKVTIFKYLLLLSLFSNVAYLVLSQAKNSIIALIIIIAILLFIHRKSLNFNSFYTILTLIMVLSVIMLILFKLFEIRYIYFLTEGLVLSVDYRIYHWLCSILIIKNNLLFGVGTGLDMNYLNKCYSSFSRLDLIDMGTHNQYLNLLLESGILGFSIIIFWFFQLIKKSIQIQHKTLFCYIIIMLVAMITENIFSNQKAIFITFSTLSLLLFNNRYFQKAANE